MSSSSSSVIETFNKLNIKYGSCGLTMVNGHKKPTFTNGKWQDSVYDSKLNGCFVKTGQESNLSILDLDDMDHPTCKKLKVLAEVCCNMVVQTKKGFHYYFKLDDTMLRGRHVKEHEFDYLANGTIAFAPPSHYKDMTKTTCKYTLLKKPEKKQPLNPMSDELITELKSLFKSGELNKEEDDMK